MDARGVRRGVRARDYPRVCVWVSDAAPRGGEGVTVRRGCARGGIARGGIARERRGRVRPRRRGRQGLFREDEPRVDGCVDWTARGRAESSRLAAIEHLRAKRRIFASSASSSSAGKTREDPASSRQSSRSSRLSHELVERCVMWRAEGAGEGTMKQRLSSRASPARTRGGFFAARVISHCRLNRHGWTSRSPQSQYSAHTRAEHPHARCPSSRSRSASRPRGASDRPARARPAIRARPRPPPPGRHGDRPPSSPRPSPPRTPTRTASACGAPPTVPTPLGLAAGPSPIPFVNGDLTGYWFLDVFAYMNLVLIVALLGASMRGIEDDGRGGSTGEGPLGGMRSSVEEEEDQSRS